MMETTPNQVEELFNQWCRNPDKELLCRAVDEFVRYHESLGTDTSTAAFATALLRGLLLMGSAAIVTTGVGPELSAALHHQWIMRACGLCERWNAEFIDAVLDLVKNGSH